jgi:resuscitation-promoting factor RpfB
LSQHRRRPPVRRRRGRRVGAFLLTAVTAAVAISVGVVYGIGHYYHRGRIDPVADVVAQIPVSRPAARLERERQHMIQMASASRTLSLVGAPKLATRPQAPAAVATPAALAVPAAPGTTPAPGPSAPPPNPGTAQSIAYSMLSSFGWSPSAQFSCLDNIWTRESGWRWNAENASGAYGIPQALPGSKMASAGADWLTNPATQIKWGLGYIQGRYGSPCAAWGFWQGNGWY